MASLSPDNRAEAGAVSVEFALLMPLLLMLIVALAHFGSVIVTRHQVTDAVNFAVRAAVVQRTPAANEVQALLLNRMGSAADRCEQLTVTSELITDAVGLTILDTNVTCDVPPPIGGTLIGAIVGPDDFTVSAAMPY